MATDPVRSINSWLEEEIYSTYRHDQALVDPSWQELFQDGRANGEPNGEPKAQSSRPPASKSSATSPASSQTTLAPVSDGDELVQLKGAPARIAENMGASLSMPTATSQRTVPVKVIDENRRIINNHLAVIGRGKVSYTHLIAWSIVQALKSYPNLNNAYTDTPDGPARIVRNQINIGLAVDVPGKDGARSLLVPSIKNAGEMDFQQFLQAFDGIVSRARAGKLTLDDFKGTTISLTNPGTVGTVGSIPRLMVGQGAIIATGVIDYPAGFQGAAPDTLASLGISKVMTLTCTYDHRVIQGAESGLFLGKLHSLLQGEESFYDRIFEDLKLPYRPVVWHSDQEGANPLGRNTSWESLQKEAAVLQMINAYRVRGHLIADLNPIGFTPGYHPELDPATYGFTIWDLDRTFLRGTLGAPDDECGGESTAPLREILERLRRTYSGKIGCQYMHIQDTDQKRWLQMRMEPEANNWPLEHDLRVRILERLLQAEGLEHFLHTRFVGQKRFSLEGGETTLCVLDHILSQSANDGVEEVVLGIAHRGRLNVLANIVGKPLTQIFSEFEGDPDPLSTQGSGDVKYHLGASGAFQTAGGREVCVSMAPNPSHLEAVDPVVEGIVRSKQDIRADDDRSFVIPVLLHGDAAFSGQGVVTETLNFSQLYGYRTGGTIHLVINNQIGFTTGVSASRSSEYATDVARVVQAPIFHVNADDPEAAIRVTQIAFEFRQRFKKDVVIDLICYRRHGHNEGDDPSYTQPLMYQLIKDHPSTATIYSARLVREKVLAKEKVAEMKKAISARLEDAYQKAQQKGEQFEVQELSTVHFDPREIATPATETAISRKQFEAIIQGLTTLPEGFRLHNKLRGFLDKRREVLSGAPVDWSLAEALAFGSLVLDGTPVRLSGQDSQRGTFSQRHATFYDNETARPYRPLQFLSDQQARFTVYDSSLSEYGVLGFEFGYSIGNPFALVLWEAQFGDFANGGQIMIDQFIACSEQKWGQPSGLTLLLPHGYEGQGPEHSSARIERFLILCAEGNMQVANCTTPAQYFHLLRRQIRGGKDLRGVRKPLVIFTPKSLLRHKEATSRPEEFTSGRFHEIIPDAHAHPGKVRRILFCSGKVYYDLLARRQEKKAEDVAIVRVEQLYPFAEEQAGSVIERFAKADEYFWVQEEPGNMGAWRFMQDWIDPMLDANGCRKLRYAGRPRSASPAVGSHKKHLQQQERLLEVAFAPIDTNKE